MVQELIQRKQEAMHYFQGCRETSFTYSRQQCLSAISLLHGISVSSLIDYPFTVGPGSVLLLLLSHFSRVRLCVTPRTAAHQAPPSLGFSRQEHWSGLPFPSPLYESEKWKGSRSVVSDSSDPMDCSLPDSSVHGIFQARALEWGAIAFSDVVCNILQMSQWRRKWRGIKIEANVVKRF